MSRERALVLGGGGVAGVAWLTGVLAGLAQAGVDLSNANFILGTSAGAMVGARLASGASLETMFDAQVKRDPPASEVWGVAGALARMHAFLERLNAQTADPGERLRRIGELSLRTATVSSAERRAFVERFLGGHDWPKRELGLTAINAMTGEPRVLDCRCGSNLVAAVAASAAVPGIYPPISIGGCAYFDAGLRSYTNLDLAGEYRRTLVIAPFSDLPLDRDREAIVSRGGSIEIITPDAASRAAFSDDSLDPAVRVPCARAGYRQTQELARPVAVFWTSVSS